MSRLFALWCMIFCLMGAAALAETKVEIAADEWTWEAGGISTLHGSIHADQDYTDATLALRVETRLEDSGEAVFTVLDGEKLKIRKRAPEVKADLAAGKEMTFEANWNLPVEMASEIAYAEVFLTVTDQEGKEIASGRLEAGSEQADAVADPVQLAGRIILWMSIACIAVWTLAICRHAILNRNGKRKE